VTAPVKNLSFFSTLSIIVPTYNRRPSLQRLLRSIDDLEVPGLSRVEVIVVDNASSDDTADLLSHEINPLKNMSFVVLTEFDRGKASALNRGLAAAKGDLLLVLDDDVIADRSLITEHLRCYAENSFDAVQGRILPGVDPEGKSADETRLHEYNLPLTNHGSTCREITGLTGTNMSFKRAVFEKVGLFRPELGPGASGFSEDTEYSGRIRKAGFRIGYTPGAVVYHELNPSRYGRKYKRRRGYLEGQSRSVYRRDSILLKVIPDLVANCLRYAVYRSLGLAQKAYKTEGRIMKRWGYLVGRIVGVESANKREGKLF
jgi:GT2 family glycosyltransferase